MVLSSLRELISSFADRSTAVGPAHIKHSPSVPGKLLWTAILVGAIAITLYQVGSKITTYCEYDKKVTTEIIFDRQLPFPAVTICNLNPYRASVVQVVAPSLWSTMLKAAERTGDRAEISLSLRNLSNASNMPERAGAAAAMITDEMQSQAWDQKTAASPADQVGGHTAEVESMLIGINKLDDAKQQAMGHALGTMLLSCTFNGVPCSPSDFQFLPNWRHGNCYTFNSGWNKDPIRVTRNPGSDFGLSLSFQLETSEYITTLSETVGLKVILHDQDQVPFPEEEGVMVSAGVHTQILIQRLDVNRADKPVKPGCQAGNNNDTNYYKLVVSGLRYQEKTCWRTCVQMEMIRRCNCRYGRYPGPSDASVCPSGNTGSTQEATIDDSCVNQVLLEYRNGQLQCNCLPACGEISFRTTLSSALWPSTRSWTDLKAQYEDDFPYLREKNVSINWAKENFAKVEIFYPDLNYEKVVETWAYQELDLLSDIGGILGFWIGLSMASLLEFVELAFQVVYRLAARLCLAKAVQVDTKVTNLP